MSFSATLLKNNVFISIPSSKQWLLAGLLLVCLGFAPDAQAKAPNVDEMLSNLQQQIPYLTQLVTGFCYVSGFYFMFKAVYHLKAYGEMRTMMASQTDLRGPITSLAIAAALMFSPTVIQIGLTTVYGNDSIMAYQGAQNTGWNDMAQTIIAIVNFVGGVAFLRGLFIFHKLGVGQAQPGTFAKGMTHLIGGVIALNIVEASNILFTTLGIQ